MNFDSSIFKILPQSRIGQTYEKILSFKDLKKGWNFGEGVSFNEKIINMALILNYEALKHCFVKTNAFPGVNGEIQVTIYLSNHFLEFTIEPDETVTFVYEKNNIEVIYEENLTFKSAMANIQKFKEEIWNSLGLFTKSTLIQTEKDLQVSPSRVLASQLSTKNVFYEQKIVSVDILKNIIERSQEYPQFFGNSLSKYSLIVVS